MEFRRLSARGVSAPAFDGPHEGLPVWMHASIAAWVDSFFGEHDQNLAYQLASLQNVLRFEPPLDWQSKFHARSDLMARVELDSVFGLDVLDGILHFMADPPRAAELNQILLTGGSAWEVTLSGDFWQLSRRAIGPVVETIEAIRTHSQRAHHHLTAAWSALVGRQPNPSSAYREAIRAVEAAAKPIVTPTDDNATLGKIIRAIRDKPEKWTMVLDKSTADQVADMADMIWKGQLDRHGTSDPDAPLSVTQDDADAAFHIALALVRLFAGGAISPTT